MGAWSDFLAKFKSGPEPMPPPAGGEASVVEPPGRPGWLERWRPGARRDRQIAWLQAGYSEMLDLIRSIRQHLDRQEDVQHKMVQVMDEIPGSMEGLKNLGAAATQQVEVLAHLRKQLEASQNHDAKLIDSMDRFNQTLGLMNETSRTSGRTVSDLIEHAKETELSLRSFIDRYERRMFTLTSIFLFLVFLCAAAVFYVANGRQFALVGPAVMSAPEPGPAADAVPTGVNVPPPIEPIPEEIEPGPEAPPAPPAAVEEKPAVEKKPVKAKKEGWFSRLFGRKHPKAKPETAEPAAEETPALGP